eukprot:1459205-Amphidinium_carterae.1
MRCNVCVWDSSELLACMAATTLARETNDDDAVLTPTAQLAYEACWCCPGRDSPAVRLDARTALDLRCTKHCLSRWRRCAGDSWGTSLRSL